MAGDNENSISTKPWTSTAAQKTSDVGQYPVTISGGVSTNYEFDYKPGVLTITKAPLTAKVSDTTRVYGHQNPSFTLKYNGLKNGAISVKWTKSPSFQTDAKTNSPIGQYDVNVSDGVAKNYDVTFSKGTLTINKAALKITADNKRRLYYEENPNLTCSFIGFVNGENASVLSASPVLSTTALINSSVGEYTINVSGAEASNYSITYGTGTLKILKRSLNASTENYTRAYNEENPTFKVNYSGFVNGENENVLISKPTASTTATKTSNVGSYTITLSGGVAENYDFTYTKGILTIEKAYQTITWNQDLSNISQFSQVKLDATASSELPITYTLSNDTVCGISYIGTQTYLDCFHYGKVIISAEQKGDKNYWPTTKAYKELNVSDATGIKDITYGKDLKDNIIINNGHIIFSNLPEGALIRVFTLSGAAVYSGTDCEIKVPSGIYIVRIGNNTTKVVVR